MTSPSSAFYVTGGTLHTDAASYVVRHADDTLYAALAQGEFCYVLTARQMGKSSLMVRTAQRLRAARGAVAVLDLTELGCDLSREQWYVGLLSRLGEQLDSGDPAKLDDALTEFWELHVLQLGPVACWFAALREVVLPYFLGPVVLFVDEVDYVRSLPFATDEFFAMIRACYNRRAHEPRFTQLTFCLLGVVTPAELIQDPETTPFNIGRRIELTDFTPAEAAPLATGLGCTPAQGVVLLRRILGWTGGHPYLTQRLCQAVAEDGHVTTPAGVDRVCQGAFLTPHAQEQDRNLPEVRKQLLLSKVDQARLLTLYAQVRRGKRLQDDENDPLISALQLVGITRVEQGRLCVRNRLYARVFDRAWIRSQMPGAALAAQRAAFWRGVRSTAAVVLLLAGGGGWYWDAYQRAHVDYYAQVITRWGLPEGVGRLSAAQVRQRNASLAFRKHGRRGPVLDIRLVNSRGAYHPVSFHTSFLPLALLNPLSQETVDGGSEGSTTSRVVFERDAQGQILNQIAYNRADRRIYTLHYVHPNMAEYKAEGITVVKRESGIALLKFLRPEHGPEAGLVQEVRYFDGTGTPQPDRDGAYGLRYRVEARGLPVEEIALGADGQPAVRKDGLATSTITYNALGNQTQMAEFGRDGQAIVNKFGVAGMKLAYDPFGNLQEVAFMGIDGQLVTMRPMGAAGRSFRYDTRGNVVETAFFDLHRQPVTGKVGGTKTVATFARQTVVWDEHGGSLETYFGTDGTPIVAMGRVVKTRAVWDTRGYLVENSFFDEHDRPLRDNNGCAKYRFRYDVGGSLVEQTCLNEKDHPICSKQGWAKVTWVRDDRGNAIEESFFGPTSQPEHYDEHYVKVRFKYNAQGKPVEMAYFDATDQPVKNNEGYAKLTYTYDLQGNGTEVAFFDAQYQPTARHGNYAKLLRTYNERNQLIEETLYDPQGHPTRHEDGYVTTRFAYDPRGYRIATAYFDVDNRPTLHSDGYAKALSHYNDKGLLDEQAVGGLDGASGLHKEGYTKMRWTYNARGKVARKEYFDAQDRLVPLVYGYATKRYTYDGLGRETLSMFVDVHGDPVHTRVVLQEVEPDRTGAQRGLQVGDILVSYDGEDLRDARTFFEFERMQGERQRELRLLRQDQDLRLTVPPGRLTGLTLVDRVPPTLPKPGLRVSGAPSTPP